MKINYKITIEKLDKVDTVSKEWNKLHNKEDFDNDKEPQYGYVETDTTETTSTTIYEQITDKELDIKKVIDAFNE